MDTTWRDDDTVTSFPDDLLDLIIYIAQSIVVDKRDGCWTVPGTYYPSVTVAGLTVKLHRLVYTLCVGPIPPGHEVDHECHNRASWCKGGTECVHRRCVRPSHLVARTHQDNMRASFRDRPPRVFKALRPGAWTATADLAVDLGYVEPDADDIAMHTAAIRLGKLITATDPNIRATDARRDRRGRRRRGFYVADLPAAFRPEEAAG